MSSTTGRCLCGAVRYRFGGPFIWTAHCHCESCRRNTASPVTTFFAIGKDGFEWTGDAPESYNSSPGVTRRFCRRCGTPMSYENASLPDEIHLYAVSLDDGAGFSPERHDFWNERVAWLPIVDDLPKCTA